MRRFDRLRRAGEIAYLRRKGRSLHLATISVFTAPSTDGAVRVGVVTSKAVGGAVARNRVRRRIRGALESLAAGPTQRMLFVAKPAAASVPYAVLAADVIAAVAGAAVPARPRSRA